METEAPVKTNEVVEKDGVFYVSGKIDEFFDFQVFLDSKNEELIIDLKGLKAINSIGIKGWLLMNKNIKGKNGTLRNLPFFLVDQMLMIDNLRGEFKIESIKLPYFCEGCDDEVQFDFMVKDIKENGIPEIKKCPECDSEASFDEAESVERIIVEDWKC